MNTLIFLWYLGLCPYRIKLINIYKASYWKVNIWQYCRLIYLIEVISFVSNLYPCNYYSCLVYVAKSLSKLLLCYKITNDYFHTTIIFSILL